MRRPGWPTVFFNPGWIGLSHPYVPYKVRRVPGGSAVRAGLRRSEAAALTWGDVQRWDDGSGRITVIRSKTDVEAASGRGDLPAAMRPLDAIRPADAGSEAKVFGLSESQIARRVKAIAKAAGLADWEFFSDHNGRVDMARRMAQNGGPPTRSSARVAGSRAAAWSVVHPRRVCWVAAAVPVGNHSEYRNCPTQYAVATMFCRSPDGRATIRCAHSN